MTSRCPLCGSLNTNVIKDIPPFITKTVKGLIWRKCNKCGSLFWENPKTFEYHKESSASEKFYIERGGGLIFFASLLLTLEQIVSKKPVKFLDVGCGYGFAVSMADYLGWKAYGVEPSPIAKAGKRDLGIKIINNYLENANFSKGEFDIILAIEVLEHVPHPGEFLKLLKFYLSSNGILCLTTPNAEAYRAENDIGKLEIISYPQHLYVFSPNALADISKNAGFNDIDIFFSEGITRRKRIIAFLSLQKLPNIRYISPTNEKNIAFLKNYLFRAIKKYEENKKYNKNSSLYQGLLYRLIEICTNQGNYALALELSWMLSKILCESYPNIEVKLSSLRNIKNFEEYLSNFPSFLKWLLYYQGMLHLNYLKDYNKAAEYFKKSGNISEWERNNNIYYNDWTMIYWAKYHQALCYLKVKSTYEKGVKVLEKLLANATQNPDIPPNIVLYSGLNLLIIYFKKQNISKIAKMGEWLCLYSKILFQKHRFSHLVNCGFSLIKRKIKQKYIL